MDSSSTGSDILQLFGKKIQKNLDHLIEPKCCKRTINISGYLANVSFGPPSSDLFTGLFYVSVDASASCFSSGSNV